MVSGLIESPISCSFHTRTQLLGCGHNYSQTGLPQPDQKEQCDLYAFLSALSKHRRDFVNTKTRGMQTMGNMRTRATLSDSVQYLYLEFHF